MLGGGSGSTYYDPPPVIPSSGTNLAALGGGSWPYYNNNNPNYDSPYYGNNWNYNMPVPSFNQAYVNNGNCYYFFATAMVYDMNTRAERIATPWEQQNMAQCQFNPYYVPCLCPTCNGYN
ncbi:hypothetical protein L596_027269 [Steinernema carpocapsae]|uniref:Uncharacterized protein n=1 Tax=Steinernema carpocapsae TaxID=34508 RepID=A0A4U5M3T5_STECR|nr:hypothetical protein L596_027269 [Steinernema carpocapsae]